MMKGFDDCVVMDGFATRFHKSYRFSTTTEEQVGHIREKIKEIKPRKGDNDNTNKINKVNQWENYNGS